MKLQAFVTGLAMGYVSYLCNAPEWAMFMCGLVGYVMGLLESLVNVYNRKQIKELGLH